ncbi:MAG: hypothetical protein K1X82_03695 [Bacteroidia bacterium]|nr:hypothetical protein [Bacteroidia bacterium]
MSIRSHRLFYSLKFVYYSEKTKILASFGQLSGNFFMPLFGKFKYPEEFEKPIIHQLSLNLGGSYSKIQTIGSPLYWSHPLINLNLGLNYFWFNGKKSAITTGIFGYCNEDNFTLSNPTVRYTGYIQWRYSLSSKVALRVGTVYTFLLGRGIPLPIFGINWRMSPKVLLNINFPFNANLNWTPGKQNMIRFFMQPNGGVSNFGNAKADLGTLSDQVILRRREYKVGASYLQYIKGKFNFSFEAGILCLRKITITPLNKKNDIGAGLDRTENKYFDSKIAPAPYINLGIGYRFGKVPPIKRKPKSKPSGELDGLSTWIDDDLIDFGQLDVGSINLDVQPLNIDAIDKFDLTEEDFQELDTFQKSETKTP